MNLTHILIIWLVTSVSLFIISKLPTGVEIDDFKKALISSAVFGILNALLLPFLGTVLAPLKIVFAASLVSLILNMIIFGLAAWLVDGFRLRWGLWSALIGALALSFINSFLLGFVLK